MIYGGRALSEGSKNLSCARGAPFSGQIYYYKRVFVVAEVDDSYVYHIHVGKRQYCADPYAI